LQQHCSATSMGSHAPSSADFITITTELEFSVHAGVIQPFLRLFVCPTRDTEARRGGHAFGTNDNMLTRA
jgi:hypothetical protein